MFTGILITLREGLEAFLVVGILLGILSKMNQKDKNKYIWIGSTSAIILSVILAYVIQWFSFQFEGTNSEIFEVFVASLAIIILTYMIIWMNKQSNHLKSELEKKMKLTIHQNQFWGLVLLAFITILREGMRLLYFCQQLLMQIKGNH